MFVIPKDVCALTASKTGLVTEASTAGLSPGEFPEFIAVVDKSNEGFLFQRRETERSEGEVMGVRYTTKSGAFSLLVIND